MVRSPTPSVYSRGSTSLFVDRDQVLAQLKDCAAHAKEALPEICEVILFGSFARGDHSGRSDADLFVILSKTEFHRPMDRIPGILKALGSTPVSVDVIPWTVKEVERARLDDNRLLRTIDNEGVRLA